MSSSTVSVKVLCDYNCLRKLEETSREYNKLTHSESRTKSTPSIDKKINSSPSEINAEKMTGNGLNRPESKLVPEPDILHQLALKKLADDSEEEEDRCWWLLDS